MVRSGRGPFKPARPRRARAMHDFPPENLRNPARILCAGLMRQFRSDQLDSTWRNRAAAQLCSQQGHGEKSASSIHHWGHRRSQLQCHVVRMSYPAPPRTAVHRPVSNVQLQFQMSCSICHADVRQIGTSFWFRCCANRVCCDCIVSRVSHARVVSNATCVKCFREDGDVGCPPGVGAWNLNIMARGL
jgi:hypothetical protein